MRAVQFLERQAFPWSITRAEKYDTIRRSQSMILAIFVINFWIRAYLDNSLGCIYGYVFKSSYFFRRFNDTDQKIEPGTVWDRFGLVFIEINFPDQFGNRPLAIRNTANWSALGLLWIWQRRTVITPQCLWIIIIHAKVSH